MAQNPVIFKEYCYTAVIFILTGHFTFFLGTVYKTYKRTAAAILDRVLPVAIFPSTFPMRPRAHQFTLVSNFPSPPKPINSDWVRVCVTPDSDHQHICPCNTNSLSIREVMRIEDVMSTKIIFTTSPHFFHKKLTGSRKENLHFDIRN